jgi:hypothetical protein
VVGLRVATGWRGDRSYTCSSSSSRRSNAIRDERRPEQEFVRTSSRVHLRHTALVCPRTYPIFWCDAALVCTLLALSRLLCGRALGRLSSGRGSRSEGAGRRHERTDRRRPREVEEKSPGKRHVVACWLCPVRRPPLVWSTGPQARRCSLSRWSVAGSHRRARSMGSDEERLLRGPGPDGIGHLPRRPHRRSSDPQPPVRRIHAMRQARRRRQFRKQTQSTYNKCMYALISCHLVHTAWCMHQNTLTVAVSFADRSSWFLVE